MLCQHCNKRPATTHVKRTVNGVTNEVHLCAHCAQEQGISLMNGFGGFGMDLGDFWGSLFGEPAALAANTAARCPGCGATFEQIARAGKVGCPSCYTEFYDRLLPSIERIHGKTRHTGKQPSAAGETAQKQSRLDELKRQLAESVEKQEYEKCAELRDEIARLEAEQEKAGEQHE
ncbi:MAG: UvrB/UvrC motif-containing protein [Clostridia bacterium]|nr:UvrB/UvrC motif-containing protein [Clostridia bacterium]